MIYFSPNFIFIIISLNLTTAQLDPIKTESPANHSGCVGGSLPLYITPIHTPTPFIGSPLDMTIYSTQIWWYTARKETDRDKESIWKATLLLLMISVVQY